MTIPGESAEQTASVFVLPKSVVVTISIAIITGIGMVGSGAWFMATQASNAQNATLAAQRFESDTNDRFQKAESNANEHFLKLQEQINGRITDLRTEVSSRFEKDESAERATEDTINNINLKLAHMEDQLEFLVRTASPNPPETGVPRK
jgi:hypothetical protein